VSDASLTGAPPHLRAEVVTPVLGWFDIPLLQDVVRALRAAGARVDGRCGVHVHVDASPHSSRSLRNLLKLVAANERHIVGALGVSADRRARYARDIDEALLERLTRNPPRTMEGLSRLWYGGRKPMPGKFDRSRYRAVNLHSVFTQGTIEFRAFNGTLHAGKIRADITLALALSAHAINARCARGGRRSYDERTTRYDLRVLLLRLGLIGEEFRAVRHHLLANCSGSAAWRRAA
jgi:hypothetical protein